MIIILLYLQYDGNMLTDRWLQSFNLYTIVKIVKMERKMSSLHPATPFGEEMEVTNNVATRGIIFSS